MSYELSDSFKDIYFKVEQFFAHKTKKIICYEAKTIAYALLY